MPECKAGVCHSHCGQIESPPPSPPPPQPHFPAPTFPPNSTVIGYAPQLYSKHRLFVTATHSFYKWSAMRAVLMFH